MNAVGTLRGDLVEPDGTPVAYQHDLVEVLESSIEPNGELLIFVRVVAPENGQPDVGQVGRTAWVDPSVVVVTPLSPPSARPEWSRSPG